MLRVISRITASYVSHRVSSASLKRLVHNSIAKPVGPTSYGIQAQAGAQTKHSPPVQDLQLTDRDYDEAMNNLKTLGLDTILNSALDRWGKLDSHGKPYIRAEIKHQWRKNVILEFVNRLCDTAFVQQTSKSSECLSKEIDNILVTSALSLAETEDECVTILCPGAPHIGTEHIDKGVKFTLRNRVFLKNDQDKLCLTLIWADENRNLYKSQAELSSTNTMWHGSLDEVLAMAEEVSNDPSNSGI